MVNERRQGRNDDATATRLAQSRRLLDHVQQISRDRLSPVLFAPALEQTLSRVFGALVLGDFRASLENRGRQWLAAAVPQPDDPAPAGPDVQDSARYETLARFSDEYQRLVENVRRYDQLARAGGTGDIASLGELSAYLDGTPLDDTPLDGMTLAPPYARTLRAAEAGSIDCGVFEVDPQSRDSLVGRRASELLRDFGAVSFGEENPVWSAASMFEADWLAVSGGRGRTQDLVSLIEDSTALARAVTAWTALGEQSADQPIPLFEQAPFARLAEANGFCNALSPDLSDSIASVTSLKNALRARLLSVSVEPFGALLKDGEPGLALADEMAALGAGLEALQSQSFWSPPPDEIESGLPPSATWRPEAANAAVQTLDAFESYRGQAFPGVKLQARRALLDVVESEVAQLLATRLALTAVAGAPLPEDAVAMLDQVGQLGTVVTTLGRLTPLLAGQSPVGPAVLRALDQQAAAALEAVNREASVQYPSVFASQNGQVFTVWANVQRAAANPAGALTRWTAVADAQRDGIRTFAMLAQPFADYLVARRSTLELAQQWAEIGRDVASYDQKLAGNGLSALDSVVRVSVPSMVPEDNCVPDRSATAPTSPGFLASAGNDIVDEGVRRCRVQAQDDYAAIADAFNAPSTGLAGKFPFSHAAEGAAEATPAQVREFFAVYAQRNGGVLRPFFETMSCSTDAVAFLRGIDNAAPLFASAMELSTPAVVLDLAPEFRVAPDRERGGDQIAQWQMVVGAQTFREPLAESPAPAP